MPPKPSNGNFKMKNDFNEQVEDLEPEEFSELAASLMGLKRKRELDDRLVKEVQADHPKQPGKRFWKC
jgi:hypothetical protein